MTGKLDTPVAKPKDAAIAQLPAVAKGQSKVAEVLNEQPLISFEGSEIPNIKNFDDLEDCKTCVTVCGMKMLCGNVDADSWELRLYRDTTFSSSGISFDDAHAKTSQICNTYEQNGPQARTALASEKIVQAIKDKHKIVIDDLEFMTKFLKRWPVLPKAFSVEFPRTMDVKYCPYVEISCHLTISKEFRDPSFDERNEDNEPSPEILKRRNALLQKGLESAIKKAFEIS